MASFRCYNNSDVIATLIMTNFYLYLIQLWWQFFQMFVYGDVVYAQTWQVLTLKNCIEALSYASTAYVVASYGPRFFSTVLQKFGQLAWIFWANGLPPPLAERRTPMFSHSLNWNSRSVSNHVQTSTIQLQTSTTADRMLGGKPTNHKWGSKC